MKKMLWVGAGLFAMALAGSACGGDKEKKEAGVDGAALAKEVCDCTTAANKLPGDAPNRAEEQDKCVQLQKDNWKKVEGNREQEKAYNDAFPCGLAEK